MMDQSRFDVDYIAAGGNRHPSAADWTSGLLAFGSGHNIALWDPEDEQHIGIATLLAGHTDHVNAVRIYATVQERLIISGSADKTLRIWGARDGEKGVTAYESKWCLEAHQASINTISVLPEKHLFVSGAADGTVNLWRMNGDQGAQLAQAIALKPKYLPLTTALASLGDGTIVLAVAGTSSSIQLFARAQKGGDLVLQATLTGHEGWIRSLDFVNDGEDLLLASGSQDKYIRLWRFSRGERASTNEHADAKNASVDPALALTKKSLSNKAREIGSDAAKYRVTFEALLIGHEDWIYTTRWAPKTDQQSSPTLLSASADNSLAIWQADEASGVWICNARLGEISAQKGSTTATGSTGGFWIGLWQADGKSVVSLGRTGSWRKWCYEEATDSWRQQIGISGHVREVRSLAWAPDGSYLLSTSSDQTTRLYAEWKRAEKRSWHEFARPQIHGYDLNCIDALSRNQFISGADEKLLRVFDKPKAVDNLLSKLSGTAPTVEGDLADSADIPVLGLSNKAITTTKGDDDPSATATNVNDHNFAESSSNALKSTLDISHPPLEDQLARHTLWPEHEKLYGHGYEISAVAASPSGGLVATACKATSLDHAVIRLYATKDWREVKPPLVAHSLTINALAWSGDGRFLLSVSRDRQWTIFGKGEQEESSFKKVAENAKGHSRMILDCDWAPLDVGYVFVTAGRDKAVKIWRLQDGKAELTATISAALPVTAVAFALQSEAESLRLAFGTEDGIIQIAKISRDTLQVMQISSLAPHIKPSGAVNRLCWRPDAMPPQLATGSDDGSIRIYNIED